MNYSKPKTAKSAMSAVRLGIRDGWGLHDIEVMHQLPQDVVRLCVNSLKADGEFDGLVDYSANSYASRNRVKYVVMRNGGGA